MFVLREATIPTRGTPTASIAPNTPITVCTGPGRLVKTSIASNNLSTNKVTTGNNAAPIPSFNSPTLVFNIFNFPAFVSAAFDALPSNSLASSPTQSIDSWVYSFKIACWSLTFSVAFAYSFDFMPDSSNANCWSANNLFSLLCSLLYSIVLFALSPRVIPSFFNAFTFPSFAFAKALAAVSTLIFFWAAISIARFVSFCASVTSFVDLVNLSIAGLNSSSVKP